MQHDKHEDDVYFYDEEDHLIASYTTYYELVDVKMMLTIEQINYINKVLNNE